MGEVQYAIVYFFLTLSKKGSDSSLRATLDSSFFPLYKTKICASALNEVQKNINLCQILTNAAAMPRMSMCTSLSQLNDRFPQNPRYSQCKTSL